jgi:soluble lytic murein transglycosylase-like protein
MKFKVLLIFIANLLFWVGSSEAGIYKYVDEKGVIHFTNCPRDPEFKLYIRDSKDDPSLPGTRLATPYVATPYVIKDSTSYDPLINEFCQKYGVDFALIKAIIRAESGFNPIAVSRKGARGLMQLMPDTASRVNVSNPFNPRENIEGGVRHFKHLLSLFNNDLRLSLAAYNAGENLVAQLGDIPPYRETIDYVQKVLEFYRSYKP